MPTLLTQTQRGAIARSLQRQAGAISQRELDEILTEIERGLLNQLNPRQVPRTIIEAGVRKTITVTEGFNGAATRTYLAGVLNDFGLPGLTDSGWLEFALQTATSVAHGAGAWVQDNLDPEVVSAWPAYEFRRRFTVEVPRGFKRGKDGALLPDPDNSWPTRWAAALDEATPKDDDVARSRAAFRATQRILALKSCDAWVKLGQGAGGYSDTLGNPFDPVAFNTGFVHASVGRRDCELLGLLEPGAPVVGAPIDLDTLFAPIPAL